MKLRRMLALTLVLMTLTTAALAENHSGFYQPQENAAMDYDESTDAQMPFEIRVEWGK